MLIRRIDPSEAALLVPLNAGMQRLHAARRPDIFPAEANAAAVTAHFAETPQKIQAANASLKPKLQ